MAANKHELGVEQVIRLVAPAGSFAGKHGAMQRTHVAPDDRASPLPPGAALAHGRVLLSEDWHLELPSPFWRRRAQGSLVLWRPELTLWLDVVDHEAESASAYVQRRAADVPARASELCLSQRGRTAQLSFRLRSASAACPALQLLIAGPQSYVHGHAYFDREPEAAAARAIFDSLSVAPPFGLRHLATSLSQS